MVRRRLRILTVLLVLPFLALIIRLWSLQVDLDSHSGYLFKAYDQYTVNILVPPLRGRILDRSGRALAENRATFQLEFRYQPASRRSSPSSALNPHPREEAIRAISREISRWQDFASEADVERHLLSLAPAARYLDGGPNESLLLVSDVPEGAVPALRRSLDEHPAFELRASGGGSHEIRFYPRQALRMELTLARLARLLSPQVTRRDLRARIDERLMWIEKRVAAELRSFRAKGAADESLLRKKERDVRLRYVTMKAVLISGVSIDAVTAIEYRPEDFPGISVKDGAERFYPLGEAAGALVGYLRKLGPRDLERLESKNRLLELGRRIGAERFELLRRGAMSRDDLIGSTGLEGRYDPRIRGLYGLRIAQKDSRDQLSDEDLERVPEVHGGDLRTTLDAGLQEFLYGELRTACGPPYSLEGGSAVVMELPSGAIRASVGFPSYDPNRMREPGYRESLNHRWGTDGGWELDRPHLMAIYPGSVFKVVTALAGLEAGGNWNGPPSVDRRYECGGQYRLSRYFRCHSDYGHGLGELNLVEALEYSCNNYFYYLAHKHLEPRRLYEWARHLGFGRPTGIDLPSNVLARGRLDEPRKVKGSRICQYAIGQYFVQATPMQVLRAIAGVAVRGRFLPRPYLVEPAAPDPLPPIRARTIDAVWEGMRRAVQNRRATAGKYGLERYSVAVKTGTAQIASGKKIYHAWIGGFGPLPEPRFAFVIALERSPRYGGETCAPVARALLEYLARDDADLLIDSSPPDSAE